ncbi:MAG TPA: tyrosine-type recombinase/integrase [Actinomycetota bacterium]|nr:tyrosine-type recombinase/integrase [Actinomycetota bacterium]
MRGTIRQRSKGSWTIQVYAGRDPVSGKKMRIARTIRGTKKEAELALAKLINSVETGIDFNATKLTFGDYAQRWLKSKEKNVRPKTMQRYSDLMRLHVVPVIGSIPLLKLKPLHLEKIYEEASKRGLSAQSVLHIHRVIFTALKQAVAWQLIPRNIAEAVTPPRPEHREVEPMTSREVVRILETVADTDLEMPTLMGLGTGMRLGEVLGLRWKDIDLEKRSARIAQTVQETKEGVVFVPPKTHRSRRTVSLPGFVVHALRKHKKEQSERRLVVGSAWHDLDLVIERGDGLPVRTSSLSGRFADRMKKEGINLTFHGLRHGHASLMLAAGVHLKVVSERLGHSTIGITADLYTHVADEVHEAAAASLDAFLGTSVKGPKK